jgi:hypothetical protein
VIPQFTDIAPKPGEYAPALWIRSPADLSVKHGAGGTCLALRGGIKSAPKSLKKRRRSERPFIEALRPLGVSVELDAREYRRIMGDIPADQAHPE